AWCCGQSGVLETIHARSQAATDFLGTMGMCYDGKFVRMRFVHHRFHFFHRHLILIDELDDVDSGVGELFDLSLAIGWALDAPTKKLGAGIWFVLNEWTGDVERRAGNFAAIDSITHINAFLQGPAEIARAGNPGHE